jgi:hypothetical protein
MVATVAGIHLGLDTHANRPAGNACPDGSFYSCSTHGLIYKSNFAGNSWATWATLGGGTPGAHASTHENGGADEIDVTGLTGAGGSSAFYLDTVTLDGTYGDEFSAASLDAKWTRRNLVAGDDIEQDGGGSWLTATLPVGTVSAGYLQTHGNTDMRIVAAMSVTAGSDQMVGPVMVDSSGDGMGAFVYQTDFYVGGLTAYAYNSAAATIGDAGTGSGAGTKYWMELDRVGNNFRARFSVNGFTYSHWTGTLSSTKTIDRIGILRHLGSAACTVAIDRFNKTA